MKRIEVWLLTTSEPLVHDAICTYQKGDFYCVQCWSNDTQQASQVFKYPITHIFRVVEGYGTHGGDTLR